MSGFDIVLERQFDRATLNRALGAVFDVATHDVAVVDSIEAAPKGKAVIVERTSLNGDFRSQLAFYITEEVVDRDPIDVAKRLCSVLHVRALVSDMSLNPYTMLLINDTAEVRPVTLDVESLDEREEYRLSREVKGHD